MQYVVCLVSLLDEAGTHLPTPREGGGVVVSASDLESKGPGFDPRAVPKSECMFVNIYHY